MFITIGFFIGFIIGVILKGEMDKAIIHKHFEGIEEHYKEEK